MKNAKALSAEELKQLFANNDEAIDGKLYLELFSSQHEGFSTAFTLSDLFNHLLRMSEKDGADLCSELPTLIRLFLHDLLIVEKNPEQDRKLKVDEKLLDDLFNRYLDAENNKFKELALWIFNQKALILLISDEIIIKVMQKWPSDFSELVHCVLDEREANNIDFSICLQKRGSVAYFQNVFECRNDQREKSDELPKLHAKLKELGEQKILVPLFTYEFVNRLSPKNKFHEYYNAIISTRTKLYRDAINALLTQDNKEDLEKVYKQINDANIKDFAASLITLANKLKEFNKPKKIFKDDDNFKAAFFCEKVNKIEIKPVPSTLAIALIRIAVYELQESYLQMILSSNDAALERGLLLLALHQTIECARSFREQRALKDEFSNALCYSPNKTFQKNHDAIIALLSTPKLGREDGTYYATAPMLNFVKDKQIKNSLSRQDIIGIFKANPFMSEDIALELLDNLKERDVLEILHYCYAKNKFKDYNSQISVQIDNIEQPYSHFDFEKRDTKDAPFSKVMQAMAQKVNMEHVPAYFRQHKTDANQQSVILTLRMAKYQMQETRKKNLEKRFGFLARLFARFFSKKDEEAFIENSEDYSKAKQEFKIVNSEDKKKMGDNEPDIKPHKIQVAGGAYATIGSKMRGQKKVHILDTNTSKVLFSVNTNSVQNTSPINITDLLQYDSSLHLLLKANSAKSHVDHILVEGISEEFSMVNPINDQQKNAIATMRKTECKPTQAFFDKQKAMGNDKNYKEDFSPIEQIIINK